MKKLTKAAALILSLLMIFSCIPALANETEYKLPQQPFYLSFTGTVKDIENKDNEITRVYLEDKDGSPATFILSENTYYVNDIKIEKGMEITGFYESGRPMIMIYPPQYSIDIVAPVFEHEFIKADKFDSDLLSKDKMLKLNISEDTEIIWANGTVMNWIKAPTSEELELALSNRKLVVFYNITTKSIPAQTTPIKVIVLSQQEFENYSIIVNGNLIEAPLAFVNEDGIIMVPVRAISEALNYEISWNNQENAAGIGKDILIKIGDTNFINIDKSPVQLETAPVLVNDRTFVPLSFFNDLAGVNSVSFTDNNIVIN